MTAVQKLNGVYRLYRLCQSMKPTKKLESHSLLICNVMRNCLSANKLPVSSVASPYRVARPASKKQDSGPHKSFAYQARENDLVFESEPEECLVSEEPPGADDFGISTDHCTRGFFDPCSILNTNLGHPKKLMTEPNELKLKNLFSLVSLQDETNLPFSTNPSKGDLQKKTRSSTPETRSDQKVAGDGMNSKDSTCQTASRTPDDGICLYNVSKVSESSIRAGTVGEFTWILIIIIVVIILIIIILIITMESFLWGMHVFSEQTMIFFSHSQPRLLIGRSLGQSPAFDFQVKDLRAKRSSQNYRRMTSQLRHLWLAN